MKYIKKFTEAIYNKDYAGKRMTPVLLGIEQNKVKKTPNAGQSRVFRLFNNDLLFLRKFLYNEMGNIDLRLLNTGVYGMAFDFLNSQRLKENKKFFEEGFYGIKDFPTNKPPVIKLTASEREAKNLIKIINGQKNGKYEYIAKYYWIKEVPLTSDVINRKQLNDDDIESKNKELWYNSNRSVKNKLYIICMERVDLLSEAEETIVGFLRNELLKGRKNKYVVSGYEDLYDDMEEEEDVKEYEKRLLTLYKIKNTDFEDIMDLSYSIAYELYQYPKYEKTYIMDVIKKYHIYEDEFVNTCSEYIKLLKKMINSKIPIIDVHGENVGWNNEVGMIAFDIMF